MATNDQALTRTYGPMRKIVKLTKKNKTTSYAKLECGHRTTVKLSTTREQKRCYRCRPDVKARGAKRGARSAGREARVGEARQGGGVKLAL
jgi:hypothetical protein